MQAHQNAKPDAMRLADLASAPSLTHYQDLSLKTFPLLCELSIQTKLTRQYIADIENRFLPVLAWLGWPLGDARESTVP